MDVRLKILALGLFCGDTDFGDLTGKRPLHAPGHSQSDRNGCLEITIRIVEDRRSKIEDRRPKTEDRQRRDFRSSIFYSRSSTLDPLPSILVPRPPIYDVW